MWIRKMILTGALFGAASMQGQILPEIKMVDNGLSFKVIEGYEDYKIVASHWRTDKNELRYVLANPVAFEAMKKKTLPMPEGSKIVKIGWTVKAMERFPAALEADQIQRIEYMVKDSKRFDANGDHWGYARFVKKGENYIPYPNGSGECIACHAAVGGNDYLFSTYQPIF